MALDKRMPEDNFAIEMEYVEDNITKFVSALSKQLDDIEIEINDIRISDSKRKATTLS